MSRETPHSNNEALVKEEDVSSKSDALEKGEDISANNDDFEKEGGVSANNDVLDKEEVVPDGGDDFTMEYSPPTSPEAATQTALRNLNKEFQTPAVKARLSHQSQADRTRRHCRSIPSLYLTQSRRGRPT